MKRFFGHFCLLQEHKEPHEEELEELGEALLDELVRRQLRHLFERLQLELLAAEQRGEVCPLGVQYDMQLPSSLPRKRHVCAFTCQLLMARFLADVEDYLLLDVLEQGVAALHF